MRLVRLGVARGRCISFAFFSASIAANFASLSVAFSFIALALSSAALALSSAVAVSVLSRILSSLPFFAEAEEGLELGLLRLDRVELRLRRVEARLLRLAHRLLVVAQDRLLVAAASERPPQLHRDQLAVGVAASL